MNHNPSGIPIAKDPITMNIVIKIEKSEFGFNGHLMISPKYLYIYLITYAYIFNTAVTVFIPKTNIDRILSHYSNQQD